MDLDGHPGYLGWTSQGVIAIHADWPAYPAEHGTRVALESLGMFPEGTRFAQLDDIDQCVLLVAEGIGRGEDPFGAGRFHVAIWHQDLIGLARSGLVEDVTGVSEAVHALNEVRGLQGQAPVTSWPGDHAVPREIDLFFHGGKKGRYETLLHDLDNVEHSWIYFERGATVVLTTAGWRALDDALSSEFEPPAPLMERLAPMVSAGYYDTAIREVSVHLEVLMRRRVGVAAMYGGRLVKRYVEHLHDRQLMPDANLKVLRGELRTALMFVRNEFAHNVADLTRPRGLALLQRISNLYRTVATF